MALIYPTTNLAAAKDGAAFTATSGKGVYIYDENGKEYLEGLAGLWCTSLGFGNQELIEASNQQMSEMAYYHMFGGKSHRPAEQLAEKLAAMVPVKNARVFFGNSGSDANDTNLKILRYWAQVTGQPDKFKVIARERSYHGVTMASACLTGLPPNHAHFELPFDAVGILRTDAPHYYRQALPGESEAQFASRLVDNLETLIQHQGAENIAAFCHEPITGASGVIVPPATYHEKLNAVLQKYGIFNWADEVICGFGRTGQDFGSTTMGITPDIMTMAKGLSSGYIPISASVISGDIYDALVEPSAKVGVFGHGYTYTGHPVACAVALKTLEIYERDNIFGHAQQVGDYFMTRLRELENHPLVGEVRGRGLLAAVEMVANKETRQAFEGGVIGSYCQQRCQENGLIVRAVAGSSIALCPPLVITAEQVDELMEKLTLSINETAEFAQQQSLV